MLAEHVKDALIGMVRRVVRWREAPALVGTLFFLAVGIAVSDAARRLLPAQGDAFLIAALVSPIIVYLVLSGRLEEFRGPGGIGGKLREVSNRQVETTARTSTIEFRWLEKGNLADLDTFLGREPLPGTTALLLRLKLLSLYDEWTLEQYAERLTGIRNLVFVVVVDQLGRFIAYFPVELLLPRLTRTDASVPTRSMAARLVQAVINGDRAAVVRLEGAVGETIRHDTNFLRALELAEKHQLEGILVLDDSEHVVGVVQRSEIVAQILLTLMGSGR